MTYLFRKSVRIYNLTILRRVRQCGFQIIRNWWRNVGKRSNSFCIEIYWMTVCYPFIVIHFHHPFSLYSLLIVACSHHLCQGRVSHRDYSNDRWSKLPLLPCIFGDGHQPHRGYIPRRIIVPFPFLMTSYSKLPPDEAWFCQGFISSNARSHCRWGDTDSLVTRKDGIFMGYVSFREGKIACFFSRNCAWCVFFAAKTCNLLHMRLIVISLVRTFEHVGLRRRRRSNKHSCFF